MKRAKLLVSSMALSLLLGGLVGCSSGDKTVGGSTPAETPKEDKKQEIELELFQSKPEVVGVMDQIIEKFMEENPGIKITQTSTNDGRTVLQTRLSANEMPDILNSFPAEDFYKTMFREGLMVELTDKDFLNRVEPNVLKMAECDEKLYALPMSVSVYGMYIRTDIFEENGVKEPETYDELIEACERLQAVGITPFVFPNKDVGNIAQRFERITGVINNDSNSEFAKIAAGELDVKDSPTLNAHADLISQLMKYGSDDSLAIDYDSAMADFSNGKAAMMFNGSWGLSTMQKNNPDIQVKLIPFPNPTGETKVPINIDTSYSVTTACKYPEEALKFIEFLSRPEIAQMYCDVDGNPSLIEGVEYPIVQHASMKETVDVGNTFLTALNFWPNGLREEIRNSVQQFIMDNDKDAFLEACKQAIDTIYNQ